MPISNSAPLARIVKLIQRGTITLNAVSSNTATITAVDTSRAELTPLGWESDANDTKTATRLALTNGTTVTGTRNSSSGITIVGYQVVERYF